MSFLSYHMCSSSISYHILPLTATMNWIRAIHQEEEEDMFFVEDKDEDTLVTHYLLQQEALVVGVPQMLHRSGQIKRAMTLVMHKYVQITSRSRVLPMHFRRRYILVFYCNTNVRGNIDSILVCRIRMHPNMFLRIVQAVENVDPYFHCRYDVVGRAGLTTLQKCATVVCILAYGLPVDAVNEYVRIAESTVCEALNHFCAAVINVFGQ
jgi:hypothetical protein